MKAQHVVPWISPYSNWKRETLNMATATGTGMLIGSLIGGRRGALIGAAAGGVARWVRWWTTR